MLLKVNCAEREPSTYSLFFVKAGCVSRRYEAQIERDIFHDNRNHQSEWINSIRLSDTLLETLPLLNDESDLKEMDSLLLWSIK